MSARKLKILDHIIPARRNKPCRIFPALRLQGKWLQDAGFEPGQQVNVVVEQGRLVISPEKKGGCHD